MVAGGVVGGFVAGVEVNSIAKLTGHKGGTIHDPTISAVATAIGSDGTGGLIKLVVNFQLCTLGVGADRRHDYRGDFIQVVPAALEAANRAK